MTIKNLVVFVALLWTLACIIFIANPYADANPPGPPEPWPPEAIDMYVTSGISHQLLVYAYALWVQTGRQPNVFALRDSGLLNDDPKELQNIVELIKNQGIYDVVFPPR